MWKVTAYTIWCFWGAIIILVKRIATGARTLRTTANLPGFRGSYNSPISLSHSRCTLWLNGLMWGGAYPSAFRFPALPLDWGQIFGQTYHILRGSWQERRSLAPRGAEAFTQRTPSLPYDQIWWWKDRLSHLCCFKVLKCIRGSFFVSERGRDREHRR